MIIEKIGEGKTVDEAKDNALLMMGLDSDTDADYDFEIISMPQKKKFGIFGGSLAKVRVFREVEDEKSSDDKPQEVCEKNEPSKKATAEKSTADTAEKKHKPVGKLSDDEIKSVVDYLETVLKNMGVSEFTTNIVPLEDGIMINIDGPKLGVVIGRKGETVDALQHLVSLVANRGKDEYFRVTLNPGQYREKRESVLIEVAKKSAEKALRTKRNTVLEPMNSFERRIVHNAVQDIEGIESWSVGEGDHRRVVIGNKEFASRGYGNRGDRNDRRGGYNRSRGRGGYNKSRGGYKGKSEYQSKSAPSREPIKDSNGPLYGVIKHD